MTEEVKLFVDSPPFTKAKVGEGYEAVACDEPRVELADEEYGGFHVEGFISFLKLWVFLEGGLHLLREREKKEIVTFQIAKMVWRNFRD